VETGNRGYVLAQLMLFYERVAMLVVSGSLMTRCLTDVVSKNDFVLNSQYLVTVLVVIPR